MKDYHYPCNNMQRLSRSRFDWQSYER